MNFKMLLPKGSWFWIIGLCEITTNKLQTKKFYSHRIPDPWTMKKFLKIFYILDYKRNINDFDITVGSNYSLMSEIPDYAAYLEISNAF